MIVSNLQIMKQARKVFLLVTEPHLDSRSSAPGPASVNGVPSPTSCHSSGSSPGFS